MFLLLALSCARTSAAQSVMAPGGVNFGNGNTFLSRHGNGAPASSCVSSLQQYTQDDDTSGNPLWVCQNGTMIHLTGTVSGGGGGQTLTASQANDLVHQDTRYGVFSLLDPKYNFNFAPGADNTVAMKALFTDAGCAVHEGFIQQYLALIPTAYPVNIQPENVFVYSGGRVTGTSGGSFGGALIASIGSPGRLLMVNDSAPAVTCKRADGSTESASLGGSGIEIDHISFRGESGGGLVDIGLHAYGTNNNFHDNNFTQFGGPAAIVGGQDPYFTHNNVTNSGQSFFTGGGHALPQTCGGLIFDDLSTGTTQCMAAAVECIGQDTHCNYNEISTGEGQINPNYNPTAAYPNLAGLMTAGGNTEAIGNLIQRSGVGWINFSQSSRFLGNRDEMNSGIGFLNYSTGIIFQGNQLLANCTGQHLADGSLNSACDGIQDNEPQANNVYSQNVIGSNNGFGPSYYRACYSEWGGSGGAQNQFKSDNVCGAPQRALTGSSGNATVEVQRDNKPVDITGNNGPWDVSSGKQNYVVNFLSSGTYITGISGASAGQHYTIYVQGPLTITPSLWFHTCADETEIYNLAQYTTVSFEVVSGSTLGTDGYPSQVRQEGCQNSPVAQVGANTAAIAANGTNSLGNWMEAWYQGSSRYTSLGSDVWACWANAADPSNNPADTCIKRVGPGVFGFVDGAGNSNVTLQASTVSATYGNFTNLTINGQPYSAGTSNPSGNGTYTVTTTTKPTTSGNMVVTDSSGNFNDSGQPIPTPYTPPTGPPNQVCATNATPGSGNAACSLRALAPADMPQSVMQYIDFAVETGITTKGVPTYLQAGTGLNVVVKGSTQTVTIGPNGTSCSTSSDVTLALAASSGDNYIFGTCTNGTFGLLTTTTVPSISHEDATPLCIGTTAAPQYWFDLEQNLWQVCTTNTGTTSGWTAAANQMVALGVADATASTIDAVAAMPLGLPPGEQYQLFGDGASGNSVVSSGTNYSDGLMNYTSFQCTGSATVTAHGPNGTYAGTGILISSQWPMMLTGSCTLSTVGAGGNAPASAATGQGTKPANGWFGAAGGCGGQGTTSTTYSGGGRAAFPNPGIISGGCGAGTGNKGESVNANWGTGAIPPISAVFQAMSGQGSPGTGDGTNAGGAGAPATLPIWLRAPGVYIGPTATVTAAGAVGTACTTGNTGSGGSSGGSIIEFNVNYLNVASGGTITAAGGAAPSPTLCGTATLGATAGGDGVWYVRHAF